MENKWMHIAFEEAKIAESKDEVPVGAVIVYDNNTILSQSHNMSENKENPTCHAEMIAIQSAIKKISVGKLTNCDIYVTLEPCPMCAFAISLVRIRRVYFGCWNQKTGAYGGAIDINNIIFSHKPEVYESIMEEECTELIKSYFYRKRKHNVENIFSRQYSKTLFIE